MTRRNLINARLMAGVCLGLIGLLTSGSARAEQTAPLTGAGAEGTEVSGVIVTAERSVAAAAAPAKASLDQTQPEAIISHNFIEQVTPEVGGWADIVTIAPGMSGITSNAGGVGEYSKVTLRGFQDGFFNITYDGIAFGDTNNPTHHAASYWPASTIGAAVVDRGPGAAGDLGQANFGGAIHFFSPEVSDQFGAAQKATYGSFDTFAAVSTLNTGEIRQLGGGKLLLNFDERWSGGELDQSGGDAFNQLIKYVQPIGDKGSITFFASHEWTKFYQADAGPGETWAQTLAYGKNFALNDDPTSEHYKGYNYEKKQTDFEYIDLKYQVLPSVVVEIQPYTYFYSNKTKAADCITDLLTTNSCSALQEISTYSKAKLPLPAPALASDIGGYDKLNEYHVYGDVTRINKDWSFGTLKVGGLVESSGTDRHNFYQDFSQGYIPDNKYATSGSGANLKLLEHSTWFQWQAFVDFNWRPIDGLTISPGFKYVNFTRNVNAAWESVAAPPGSTAGGKHAALVASNTYTSPLYFATVNYKIFHDLAVYGQFATSFVIPPLSDLYVTGVGLQALKPNQTTTFQGGVVYTHGPFTADADVYRIDATNLEVACNVPDPISGNPNNTAAEFCNVGKARYSGVEGEAAYTVGHGLTVFANGSLDSPKQLANPANPALSVAAIPAGTLANSPKSTAAVGGIYSRGPWQASLIFKYSGPYVAGYNSVNQAYHLPGFGSLDTSVAYDFGQFRIKLQAYNLLDRRDITVFTPASGTSSLHNPSVSDTSLYQFQAGREVDLTLIAKY